MLLNELQGHETFMKPIGHRAIGVECNPGSEQGNYVPSILPQRYDAFLFIDQTQALNPLTGTSGARRGISSMYNSNSHFGANRLIPDY